jgi:hypothetical protein
VFYIYSLFLLLSGIAMLVMASVKTGQTTARRIWNAAFGAGFTLYGLYLLLFSRAGTTYSSSMPSSFRHPSGPNDRPLLP